MFARITLFEIDTLRMSLDDALERFKEFVVPEARKREGYEGMYVMRTPEGKGLIMSLWEERGSSYGRYSERILRGAGV
jgi:heme-degrading monooxygenase HmoA